MPDTETAPTTQITIQGLPFEAPQPYKAGAYTLSEGESSALNQTLAENLRNNFAPKIKAAIEAFRKANGLGEDVEVPVTELDHEALIEEFNKYADEYEFGVRRAGGVRAPVDPVGKEAHRIASQKVRDALKKKGVKIDTVSKEKMGELIAAVIDKYPEIKEEAKRRVESTQAVAVEGLEALGL